MWGQEHVLSVVNMSFVSGKMPSPIKINREEDFHIVRINYNLASHIKH